MHLHCLLRSCHPHMHLHCLLRASVLLPPAHASSLLVGECALATRTCIFIACCGAVSWLTLQLHPTAQRAPLFRYVASCLCSIGPLSRTHTHTLLSLTHTHTRTPSSLARILNHAPLQVLKEKLLDEFQSSARIATHHVPAALPAHATPPPTTRAHARTCRSRVAVFTVVARQHCSQSRFCTRSLCSSQRTSHRTATAYSLFTACS